MASINERFMEEYKRLDKLCREAYNTEKGVTTYIDAMKAVSAEKSRAVSGWNSDLSRLISLRHMRNQFAHDVGTVASALCNEDDIEWLKAFHARIMDTRDPLALLEKSAAKRPKKTADAAYGQEHLHEGEPAAEPRGCLPAVVVGILCAAIIIVAVILSTR